MEHEVRVEDERLLDFVRDDAADEVRVSAVQRRHQLVQRLLHTAHTNTRVSVFSSAHVH